MKTPDQVAREITDDRRHLWWDKYDRGLDVDALTKLIRDAVEAAAADALRHGFAGCPVSDERLAEIHAHWDKWENRGDLPTMRRDRFDLLTLVDWQRSVIATLAGSPEGDDLKALLEAARREGAEAARRAFVWLVDETFDHGLVVTKDVIDALKGAKL